tara:strand:+ start:3718 stop:4788 length:1071 start_codon:yes stop_codon:yes gene_type:complete
MKRKLVRIHNREEVEQWAQFHTIRVSSYGRIESSNGKIYTPQLDEVGDAHVDINELNAVRPTQIKTHLVHELVQLCFKERWVKFHNIHVSTFGQIESATGVKYLPAPNKAGRCGISIKGKKYQFHRVMTEAFGLPRLEGQIEVDHIDREPSNNKLWNLRWVTSSENKKNRRQFSCKIVTEDPQLSGETWKPFLSIWVSSFGRVRTMGHGKKLVTYTPKTNASGYRVVSVNGSNHRVHVAIATAFALPRDLDQTQVDHKNGIGCDNRLENLRWVTPSANIQHSYDTNPTRGSCAARMSKVVEGKEVGATEWTAYDSSSEAARKLRLKPGDISRCCRGKRKQTGGYKFQYRVGIAVSH